MHPQLRTTAPSTHRLSPPEQSPDTSGAAAAANPPAVPPAAEQPHVQVTMTLLPCIPSSSLMSARSSTWTIKHPHPRIHAPLPLTACRCRSDRLVPQMLPQQLPTQLLSRLPSHRIHGDGAPKLDQRGHKVLKPKLEGRREALRPICPPAGCLPTAGAVEVWVFLAQ